MKYTLEIEIADDEISFAEEFFKKISFVKHVRLIAPNENINSAALQSIDDEAGKPMPFQFGAAKGLISMSDDFNEPLEEFIPYTE